MTQKILLLVQTGEPPPLVKREQGDMPVWFRHVLPEWYDLFRTVRVFDGEALPLPDADMVVLVSGSWAMVTDRSEWIEVTAAWLRQVIQCGGAVFGMCFGHQLLAYALGGVVDYNPAGPEVGCRMVLLTDEGISDPLLRNLPPCFPALLSHWQTVMRLPVGAVNLAVSENDHCQIIRYNERVYSTQFHPEFTTDIAASVIRFRADSLLSEGVNTGRVLNGLHETRYAESILINFVRASMADDERFH